ncbi:GDP-6-deoxy-D-mannose reductase [Fundidesulfovibrio magnetotacticus]|uniref:GDP-6-deoxy-D-mannose reductase n=1 Tax=Fundidesulfovibrio magnetotacticus TaxID=2730080 RepID=A0A6V8LXG2_9BACT|nr:NAD(P)-dependent oxidoreductase [Fundidesulfovibrio magnetotacticus]GFK94948.1 GDP-6-deoxy-D-mannose reductase [Fundidesulfovibrio magnetotacticus]
MIEQCKDVLIFGAGGFIGSTAAAFLAARGWNVEARTRQDCDLTDPDAAAKVFAGRSRPVRVLLCACVSRHLEDTFGTMVKNVAMVENFLRAARPGQVASCVYLSSTDVYGNRPLLPVTEETAALPEFYYGVSKLANETLLLRAGLADFPVAALRLPGIYGPTDQGHSILGMFARRVLRGEPLTVYGDGGTLRDFVLVTDLCSVIERLLEREFHGPLNVATGSSMRLLDILHLLAAAAGRELDLRHAPAGSRSHDLAFDTRGLHAAVGENLSMTPLRAGVRILVDSLRAEAAPPAQAAKPGARGGAQ